jgi:hypothetical protein
MTDAAMPTTTEEVPYWKHAYALRESMYEWSNDIE